MGNKVRWLDAPESHDYDAARDYLELLVADDVAAGMALKLADAVMVRKKAKDILRAANLPLLPADDSEVAAVLAKIHDGERISPILLCRTLGGRLVIADGFHRVCACYRVDDATEVHAHLI